MIAGLGYELWLELDRCSLQRSIVARLLVDVMAQIQGDRRASAIMRIRGGWPGSSRRFTRQTSHCHLRSLSAYRVYLVPSGSTIMEGDASQTTRTPHERVVPPSTRLRLC
jgi:hypothetical protein